MKRRTFLRSVTAASASLLLPGSLRAAQDRERHQALNADVVIVGGGLGGCAAALAALRGGLSVVLTEETEWLGGQLTQQTVPPDEHTWIESKGCTRSYRALRDGIRDYYRRNYPLTDAAREAVHLNPGNGSVSRLCHEPRVALAVLESMLAAARSGGRLTVLLEHQAVSAETMGDSVRVVRVRNLRTGRELDLEAPWFVDATELGDLLPVTGTEFVTGSESSLETHELHAREKADPANQQAFTVCFAVDHLEGENHVIDRPAEYGFWRDLVPRMEPPWPGRLLDLTYTHPSTLKPKELGFAPHGQSKPGTLNLWQYRRIADRNNFAPGTYPSDVSLINWPQNDYFLGNLVGGTLEERQRHIDRAKQLSLALLYWLQTEAPRPDGGTGWPGLRLRRDLVDTDDGLAKFPYVRESRRIRAVFTVLEEHCGRENRAPVTGKTGSEVKAAEFFDTVGVGYYHIDLHPSSGGDNYIDFGSLPFQIPLGALLPCRVRNLLPASKNLGTTHITNGCYRLHPVEWNIGEAAGALIAFCQQQKTLPHAVRESTAILADFQKSLGQQGIELQW
ncbi:MAG: FAD-dependent oxidoreductase [Planctomycetaceae bacterium]|nr:FAD-dependent oxidoreductase [Planctomycetaceae bacterium]